MRLVDRTRPVCCRQDHAIPKLAWFNNMVMQKRGDFTSTGASCQCLGGDVIAHILLQRFTNETGTGEESMMISMISIA